MRVRLARARDAEQRKVRRRISKGHVGRAEIDLARRHVHAHVGHVVTEHAAVAHRIAKPDRRIDAGRVRDQEGLFPEHAGAARNGLAEIAHLLRQLCFLGLRHLFPRLELGPDRHAAIAAEQAGTRGHERHRPSQGASGIHIATLCVTLLRDVDAALEIEDALHILGIEFVEEAKVC